MEYTKKIYKSNPFAVASLLDDEQDIFNQLHTFEVDDEQKKMLQRFIKLEQWQKDLFYLHFAKGLSYKEIGKLYALTDVTIINYIKAIQCKLNK